MTPVLEALQGRSDDEKRKALKIRLEQLRRAAPTDFTAHSLYCHRDSEDRPLQFARHHQIWADLLSRPDEYPFICLVAPPGYAKSTIVSMAYPSWRMGQTAGRLRMGIVSNTADLAWQLLGYTKEMITSDRFRAAHPEVRPNFVRGWRHNALFFSETPPGKDPSLAATGIGGAVQGRRLDEIILDDPTTFEQAQSPAIMKKQRNWVKNTLMKRLPVGMRPPDGKGGRFVTVMTRWGPNDLYDVFEDMGFKMLTMPALGYWDRSYICPECGASAGPDEPLCACDAKPVIEFGEEPLWPEVESRESLLAQREADELIFELVMQGNPKVVSGEVFDPEWWAERRGNAPPREKLDKVIQAVDTAGGKDRKKGDYVAIVTMGKKGTEIWILDVKRGRLNALEQEDAVKTLQQRWKPDLVVIEDVNEGTALYQRLVSEHLNIPLKPFTPTRDKEFRAVPLANAYRQGLVNHQVGRWNMSYEAELAAFPEGPHDDQVDAASMCYANLTNVGPRVRVL